MNFDNIVYGRHYIGDSNFFFQISQTTIATWIVGGILILLAIIARIKINSFKDVPETRFQKVIESLVEFFNKFTQNTMTKQYSYFGAWFFGVFAFIAFSNILGLFAPLRPPTADLATNVAMATTTVIFMWVAGIRHNGKEHFLDYLRPVPLFLPLNLLSDFSKIISLSVRLFGNIFSGIVIMSIIYMLLPWWASIGFPGALALYFDIFVGLLHAYVFVMLSMNFILMKTPQK